MKITDLVAGLKPNLSTVKISDDRNKTLEELQKLKNQYEDLIQRLYNFQPIQLIQAEILKNYCKIPDFDINLYDPIFAHSVIHSPTKLTVKDLNKFEVNTPMMSSGKELPMPLFGLPEFTYFDYPGVTEPDTPDFPEEQPPTDEDVNNVKNVVNPETGKVENTEPVVITDEEGNAITQTGEVTTVSPVEVSTKNPLINVYPIPVANTGTEAEALLEAGYPIVKTTNTISVPDKYKETYTKSGNYIVEKGFEGYVSTIPENANKIAISTDDWNNIVEGTAKKQYYFEYNGWRYYIDEDGNVLYKEPVKDTVENLLKIGKKSEQYLKVGGKAIKLGSGDIWIFPPYFCDMLNISSELISKYPNCVSYDITGTIVIKCWKALVYAVNKLKESENLTLIKTDYIKIWMTDGQIIARADPIIVTAIKLLKWFYNTLLGKSIVKLWEDLTGMDLPDNPADVLDKELGYNTLIIIKVPIIILSNEELNPWEYIAKQLGLPYKKL